MIARNCGNQDASVVTTENNAIRIANGLDDCVIIMATDTTRVMPEEAVTALIFDSLFIVLGSIAKAINAGQASTTTMINVWGPKDAKIASPLDSKAITVNKYRILNFNLNAAGVRLCWV